jgi:hypothetical protein
MKGGIITKPDYWKAIRLLLLCFEQEDLQFDFFVFGRDKMKLC